VKDIGFFMRRVLEICCLLAIDLGAFYLSLLIALLLRSEILPAVVPGLPVFVFSYPHFLSLWWIPAVYIFFIFYESLYDNNLPFWDETRILVKSVSLATITLLAIVTLGKMGDIVSRLVLTGLWTASLFLFPVFRLWGKKYLYTAGIRREKVLIIGAGNAGRLALEGLQREKHMGYDIVGLLDDDDRKIGTTIHGKRVLGSVSDYPGVIRDFGIKTVIIAIPSLPPDNLSALTAGVQNYAVNTMLIPDLKGIALINTDLFHLFLEEIFLINIRNNLKSLTNRFVKRLFDVIVSIVSLPLILPVIGVIGLLIRAESRGAAIYAHDRIGRKGKYFKCFKFRTMQRDAEDRLKEMLESDQMLRNEWESTWKLRDDPRVTKVGHFLRKSSLDELPQIFNVLKGEMSLVGPRPYLPRELPQIRDNTKVIGSAKPGITGLWQVSGRSDTGYRYRVKLDTWYVMNWSLWLDIAIIFKTIRVVLKAEGAY
jgi:undecaprenyl-phosphate galactose phosphotransferase